MGDTPSLPPGQKDIIGKAFKSVFFSLEIFTESWFQRKRVFDFSKETYTNWMCDVIGSYPLFGTGRTVNVQNSFVPISISENQQREVYRKESEIEAEFRQGRAEHRPPAKGGKDSAHPTYYEQSVIEREQFSLLEAVNKFGSGLALLGVAGSGKTTAFKKLAVTAAKGEPISGQRRLPIFISVRDLKVSRTSLWDGMEQYLDDFDIAMPKQVLWSLLKSGQAMILVDGIDETNEDHRDMLIQELVRLQGINKRRKERSNIICVSGRPFSLSVGLANFTKLEVLPLDSELQTSFIERWFHDVNEKQGTKLALLVEQSSIISDLATTPLLLSIICALYYNDLELPTQKEELLERAIHGLLGGWDNFRGIARKTFLANVSFTRRKVFVASIAYELFTKEILVFSDQTLAQLRIVSSGSNIIDEEHTDEHDVLRSLYNDFGILVERSPGIFTFNHLSLQEYLVAKYAVEFRLELSLVAVIVANPERYYDVVRYLAKLLPKSDDFIRLLHETGDWKDMNVVRVFSAFVSENPICSVGTKEAVYRSLSKRLVTIIKKEGTGVRYCYSSRKIVFEDAHQDSIAEANNILLLFNDIGVKLTDPSVNKELALFVS